MEKCKFTKRYFNDQVVMFRYSCNDHVVEKFYYIEDDYETDAYRTIDDESDKAIVSIYYAFARDGYNQKKYYQAIINTAFGELKMEYFPTTRLDRIRNRVLKQLWEKSAMITMATGYVLDKKEITDE